MDTINYFFIFTAVVNLVYGELKIIDLKVPSTIESGSNNEVILDCDFEVKDETGLEVKWFYDNGEQQIYQWIPNASRPQAMGLLKNRVDLSYKASNDSNTMYRALRIKDITPDLSGYYTCKVTSFYNEDTATKRMIIYEPAKEFELVWIENEEDSSLTVACSASGIYPEPKIDIFVPGLNKNTTIHNYEDGDDKDNDEDDNNEDGDLEEVDTIELSEDNNMYNATSTKFYNINDLNEPTEIACKIWIPGTTYEQEIKRTYYPGGIPTTEMPLEYDYDISLNTTESENMGLQNVPSGSLLMLILGSYILIL